MPTYEYQCEACGKPFALVMTIAERGRSRPRCTHCGSEKVAQRFSAFFAQTRKKS